MSGAEPKPIVLDLEAGGDPDDLWMLLYMLAAQDAGKIRLRAVTVVGNPEEADTVAKFLAEWGGPRRPPLGCGPLGIRHARREKSSPARYAKAEEVLVEALDGAAVVVTGGPLSNLARAAGSPKCPAIRTWIGQGGVTSAAIPGAVGHRGRRTARSWNFACDPEAAARVLTSPRFKERLLVTKTVCDLLRVDERLAAALRSARPRHPALRRLAAEMIGYWERGRRKRLHDLLAAVEAVAGGVVGFSTPVRVFRARHGLWGAALDPAETSRTRVSLNFDREAFLRGLLLEG